MSSSCERKTARCAFKGSEHMRRGEGARGHGKSTLSD